MNKVEFYFEELQIDQDELENAVREELESLDVKFGRIYPKVVVEFEINEGCNE